MRASVPRTRRTAGRRRAPRTRRDRCRRRAAPRRRRARGGRAALVLDSPVAHDLDRRLGVELDAEVASVTEGLGAARRGGQLARAGRHREAAVVPLQPRPGGDLLGVGGRDLMPADLGPRRLLDGAAERGREHLPAEAEAEHRRVAHDAVAQQLQLLRDLRLALGVERRVGRAERGDEGAPLDARPLAAEPGAVDLERDRPLPQPVGQQPGRAPVAVLQDQGGLRAARLPALRELARGSFSRHEAVPIGVPRLLGSAATAASSVSKAGGSAS